MSVAPRSFESLFGTAPIVRSSASGRVNLMGDHTDYNGGFVLPAAIPQTTRVELAARADRTVRVWSAVYPDDSPVEYELGAEAHDGSWADYVKGMTVVLAPLLQARMPKPSAPAVVTVRLITETFPAAPAQMP